MLLDAPDDPVAPVVEAPEHVTGLDECKADRDSVEGFPLPPLELGVAIVSDPVVSDELASRQLTSESPTIANGSQSPNWTPEQKSQSDLRTAVGPWR